MQLSVTLTMKEIKYWIAYINKKNHNAFLIHLYGADSQFLETNWRPGKIVTSIIYAYAMQLDKFRQIDSEKCPCDKSDRNIDLEGCLKKYMEMKINCSLPWGKIHFENAEPCQTEDEFQQYYTLAKTVKYWGERGIYEKTGCQSNCYVTRYAMKKRFKLMDYSGTDEVWIWGIKGIKQNDCKL